MENPYDWLQNLMEQVPDLLQPLIVALAAAIPYVEGEGAAALGILVGINPVVAAVAAATGNILCVIGVVLLGSRIRGGVTRRRAQSARARDEEPAVATSLAGGTTTSGPGATVSPTAVDGSDAGTGVVAEEGQKPSRRSKGRARLSRWLVRFGVPGASLLAPLALPTMLTAAFLVGSGVRKEWVILWQVIAIVLWTGAVAAAATGVLAVLGW